jgi:hypothetical protein
MMDDFNEATSRYLAESKLKLILQELEWYRIWREFMYTKGPVTFHGGFSINCPFIYEKEDKK